jgi:hypothetical protein
VNKIEANISGHPLFSRMTDTTNAATIAMQRLQRGKEEGASVRPCVMMSSFIFAKNRKYPALPI